MKKKQQYALNKLFCFGIVFGSFLACVAYGFFVTNELVLGIVFALLAFAFLCVLPVFTPFVYSFDEDGVTLRYLFFPNERYLWKNVRAIVVEDKTHSSRTSLLVEFFFANVFCINGRTVGEQRFYMKGHVRKSFRTKHLFKKYWDGTITGYLFED